MPRRRPACAGIRPAADAFESGCSTMRRSPYCSPHVFTSSGYAEPQAGSAGGLSCARARCRARRRSRPARRGCSAGSWYERRHVEVQHGRLRRQVRVSHPSPCARRAGRNRWGWECRLLFTPHTMFCCNWFSRASTRRRARGRPQRPCGPRGPARCRAARPGVARSTPRSGTRDR